MAKTNNMIKTGNTQLTLLLARQRVGLTQQHVRDELGIPESTLSIWEKDSSNVKVKNLLKLCKLYHIELSDLFLGTQKEFEAQVLNVGVGDDEKRKETENGN